MARTGAFLVVWIALLPWLASAGEISARVLIDRSVGKRSVAPPVYELRGASTGSAPSFRDSTNEFERVAVWVESEQALQPPRPVLTSILQRDRRFVPELLVVPVGSTVEFPNDDPIFHNIFSLSRTQSFDLGYYPKGQSRSVKFQRAGIVQVYCHVHPSMYAAIVVTSSSWFGKPNSEGAIFWTDIPAGNYRIMAWHKVAGLFRKDVVVPNSGQVSVKISIPLDEAENGR